MIARFDRDGVALDLDPHEFGFMHLVLSYVMHGVSLDDGDFRSILGMTRPAAERLYAELKDAEMKARANGSH